MKTFLFSLVGLWLCQAGEVSLFDGKTLAGWNVQRGEERWWRVEDSCIVGGSLTEKVPFNTFLSSEKSYQNFEMRFQVKMVKGAGFINSGFQLRSTRVPKSSEMCGYQVDIGIGWWGKMYDESRRNRVIGEPIDAEAIKKAAKDWDWNDYRIVCEGSRIRSWINGVPALDYTETDPSIPQSGMIGLQAHGGGTFLVHFKNLVIEELPATAQYEGAAEAKKIPIEHAKPLTPQEQRAAFHLPPGFRIELVAAEDPASVAGKFISVCFDQQGRMWTHTALEYPVDANENTSVADALYASKAKDKILIYHRDAVFDKPLPDAGLKPNHIFADGLAIPLGILPWGDGSKCFAQHGRDIVLLTDTNNDQQADKREVLLEGFGIQDSHLLPHQFTRAPGGWIWMAQGAFNYSKVKRPQQPQEQAINFDQTRMARFRPDGSEFEITSNGPCNIWGLAMDRNGETFIQEANDYGYGVMPFHEYANYPGCSNGQWKSYAPAFPVTFAKERFGGTGLSGLCLTDTAGHFPPPYNNLMLVANPITSRINAASMTRDQPSPQHNLTDWQFSKMKDFLTCDDPWFRPVAITLGPDGCVYIVDWYNKIISHNEVPRSHPDRDKLRGRIWRIRHETNATTPVPDFTKLSNDQLQQLLKSPSLAQTHIAAQTLDDRKVTAQDLSHVPALMTKTPSLEQLGKTATSPNKHLRRETARAMAETATLPPALITLRKDPDKNVRREALTSLGYWLGKSTNKAPLFHALLDYDLVSLDQPNAKGETKGLKGLVREQYDREFERYVVRLLIERHTKDLQEFLATELAQKLPTESYLLATLALPAAQSAPLVAARLTQIGRHPNPAEVLLFMQALDQPSVLVRLRDSLNNPSSSQSTIQAILANKNRIAADRIQELIAEPVEQLFRGTADEVKRAIDLCAAFAVKNTAPRLHELALDSADPAIRIAALDALAAQKTANPIPLTSLLQNDNPDIRFHALQALAASREQDASIATIKGLESVPAQFRAQIIETLAAHKDGAIALVAGCLAATLPTKDLSSITLNRLQQVLGTDASLKKLLSQLGDQYRPVLELNGKKSATVATHVSLPGACTIETWIKLQPGINNADSLGGSPKQLDCNFYNERLHVYQNATGNAIVSKKKIVADLWTHIALTRNAAGRWKIFLNGELDNDQSATAPQKIENFTIGFSNGVMGTHGQLTEFRIWNRERSADEIRNNFDRSLPSGDASLVFYGKGDQGWGKLGKDTACFSTLDLPPVMTLEKARQFDETYQHYLTLAKTKGNLENGKALSALCVACHQFGNTGGSMGPNLSSIGSMGPEAIVRNILTPNAAIEPGYRIYRIVMNDGSLIDSFFVSEDKDAVVIRQMGAEERRIARKEIRSTQFLRQSLMPEGLLDSFTDDQRKDLFTYLMSLK